MSGDEPERVHHPMSVPDWRQPQGLRGMPGFKPTCRAEFSAWTASGRAGLGAGGRRQGQGGLSGRAKLRPVGGCCGACRAGRGTGGPRQGLAGLRDDAPSERSATKRRRCGGCRGACKAGLGAGGRRQGLAGLRDDAPSERSATKRRRCGGRHRACGACLGAGGRRQGLAGLRDRSLRAAGSRVAISRAGRRPPAHTAAKPNKTGPAAAGPDGARKTRGATSPARKSELLVVLRVLVGLTTVGAPERADRRHLFRRQREGKDVEVLALALRVTGLGQGQGAELVVPTQDEA